MMKRMVDSRSIPVLAVLLLLLPPSSDACAKTCGCKEWPPKDPSDEDKVGGVQPCKNLNRIPTMFCPRDFPSLLTLLLTLLLPPFQCAPQNALCGYCSNAVHSTFWNGGSAGHCDQYQEGASKVVCISGAAGGEKRV